MGKALQRGDMRAYPTLHCGDGKRDLQGVQAEAEKRSGDVQLLETQIYSLLLHE